MNYQSPPDLENDTPRLSALPERIAFYHTTKPTQFWTIIWLATLVITGLIAFFDGMEGFNGTHVSGPVLIAFAALVWFVPLVLLIRQKREKKNP